MYEDDYEDDGYGGGGTATAQPPNLDRPLRVSYDSQLQALRFEGEQGGKFDGFPYRPLLLTDCVFTVIEGERAGCLRTGFLGYIDGTGEEDHEATLAEIEVADLDNPAKWQPVRWNGYAWCSGTHPLTTASVVIIHNGIYAKLNTEPSPLDAEQESPE